MINNLNRVLHMIGRFVMHPKEFVVAVLSFNQRRQIDNAAKSAFFIQSQMDINPKSNWHDAEFIRQTGGYHIPDDNVDRIIDDLDPWDIVRRDMIILLLRSVLERRVDGDLAELGVYKGQTARLIHHYIPERRLHLFDTFDGFHRDDVEAESIKTGIDRKKTQFANTNVEEVLGNIECKNNNVKIYKGYFPESVPVNLRSQRFAFVHLDADLYEPTKAGLSFFCERMSKGGIVLVHDYNAWIGARMAVDEFCCENNYAAIPFPDKSGSALIVNGS